MPSTHRPCNKIHMQWVNPSAMVHVQCPLHCSEKSGVILMVLLTPAIVPFMDAAHFLVNRATEAITICSSRSCSRKSEAAKIPLPSYIYAHATCSARWNGLRACTKLFSELIGTSHPSIYRFYIRIGGAKWEYFMSFWDYRVQQNFCGISAPCI